MPDFLCVLREPQYSPGKVEDDAAILLAVALLLRRDRYMVDVFDPRSKRWPCLSRRTVVLSMAQGARALEQLALWEAAGVRVINSVVSVQNCRREKTAALLSAAGIRWPATVVVPTTATELPEWVALEGAWVKRGDVHAMAPEDVQFATNAAAACRALRELQRRGVSTAIVQRHVRGRVIKFYAVGERFFFLAQASVVPGEIKSEIALTARRAAAASGLEIFGGDCVVDEAGRCQLIDLNDWPSYAPCRRIAAEAIAAHARAQKAKVA